jgi:prolyl-tRNA editing enzyme YbaK/EbsC (Cys-tRNA(Pro) deacylase)
VTLNSGAKAMLLRAPGTEEKWILSVLPADKKLSWKKVRGLKGKATRMATEEEVARVAGCLPGAVPPFAAAFPMLAECMLDASMPSSMNFNCGLRTRSINMSREDFERVQKPIIADIAE